jgi:hypothetical protein
MTSRERGAQPGKGKTDAVDSLAVMPSQVVQPADGWQATEG